MENLRLLLLLLLFDFWMDFGCNFCGCCCSSRRFVVLLVLLPFLEEDNQNGIK